MAKSPMPPGTVEFTVTPRTMTFARALDAIVDGESVTRLEWKNQAICLMLIAGIVHIRKADYSVHTLMVSEEDIKATDWVASREH